MSKRESKFTKEIVENLKDIFNINRILEQQLINGSISEDDFIRLSKELGFNIPDDRKREYIENTWNRHKYENETDKEFKERLVKKLTELGINTISMRKQI